MTSPQIPSSPPSAYPPLDVQVSYRLGAPLVYVRGELDHQTAPRLRVVLEEEWATRPHALILELSQVSYIDSGGLALIFDTLARFKESAWLGVVGATAPVARLMEMTGLTDRPEFRMLPDLAAASAALQGPGGGD
jgi:anti-sigma B factor antagonist